MIKDEIYDQTKGKKAIELLIDEMWIPAMATDLRIFNKDDELIRVKAIRVRDLETDK